MMEYVLIKKQCLVAPLPPFVTTSSLETTKVIGNEVFKFYIYCSQLLFFVPNHQLLLSLHPLLLPLIML